jgi:hypothetical protein
MSYITRWLCLSGFTLLMSCGNDNPEKQATLQSQKDNSSATSNINTGQHKDIAGEWEQQYTCFDKNGNYKLDAEEKGPSNTRLGFDWFRFNADGSCLRDKNVKFKGTYSIQEKGSTKKLVIEGGDNLRYTIHELTDKELILGSDGAFIIFKRIE